MLDGDSREIRIYVLNITSDLFKEPYSTTDQTQTSHLQSIYLVHWIVYLTPGYF